MSAPLNIMHEPKEDKASTEALPFWLRGIDARDPSDLRTAFLPSSMYPYTRLHWDAQLPPEGYAFRPEPEKFSDLYSYSTDVHRDLDDDFKSTVTSFSKKTYFTAETPKESDLQCPRLNEDGSYAKALKNKKLWPVDPAVEQDWSGRGQHVEFDLTEREFVRQLLPVHDVLGRTSSATIESVQCRRILLARKTIFCSQSLSREQAIEELAHLTKLNHSHVVRVVGSYILGREFSILLYPVADCNLSHFMEKLRQSIGYERKEMSDSADRFYICLVSALNRIHQNLVKHMDIKPQNILVRKTYPATYKVYIADFGIAKAYNNLEDVETDGWTSYTRKYAAPEVVRQAARGHPVDVFSLGCVLLELMASLMDALDVYFLHPILRPALFWETLESTISVQDTNQKSYQANLSQLQILVRGWVADEDLLGFKENLGMFIIFNEIHDMLSESPQLRPTAMELYDNLGYKVVDCCNTGQESLEVFR